MANDGLAHWPSHKRTHKHKTNNKRMTITLSAQFKVFFAMNKFNGSIVLPQQTIPTNSRYALYIRNVKQIVCLL